MIFHVESADDVRDVLHGNGSLLIQGTNTKAAFGPPSAADHIIKTTKMSGIVEWSPDDLVIVAKAGTTIEEIDAELKSRRQMIGVPNFTTPIGKLTAGLPGTTGGIVSANLPSRWESQCRGPRYWVLGLTFIKADRTVIKCGSKAVKNVAGYDVQKLLIGAWGTLGVITEVILRTQPLRHIDNEPKADWNAEPPYCIARTLPTEIDEYIQANPIHDPVIDRETGTIWARTIKPASKPRNGWVLNAGFGEDDRPIIENDDLNRAIKTKLDPLNHLNPGRLF
ncbi:MAG: FAD-binding protein [Fimbriimonadales bacterium]